MLYPPTTLSIMPTWQCNASCADCGTYSHPKNKKSLEPDTVFFAIDKARQENFEIVVFTGGEATLKLPDLLKYIAHATGLGLPTRLVTNAWWAKSEGMARKTLASLKAAGLKEINFSTGDEHARFVSLDCIARAVLGSIAIGLHPYVMVEMRRAAGVTKESVLSVICAMDPSWSNADATFIESPWTPLNPAVMGDYVDNQRANKSNLAARGGCDSLFSTPTLQADGSMAICCGIGMQQLETLRMGYFDMRDISFSEICASAELDLVKLMVKHFGPEQTIAMASEFNSKIVWEDLYAHKCQACIRLFSDKEILSEIRSREDHFLTHLAASMATERVLEQSLDAP